MIIYIIVNTKELTVTKYQDMEKSPIASTSGKLPWNYGSKIAAATGYSRALVYKVAMGKHKNEEVQYFLDLAKSNKLTFAMALDEAARAQKLINEVGS